MFTQHIAVIGAGIAGLSAARLLAESGFQVTVFDKSRGTGGRLARCRILEGSADLGAPWLAPVGDDFRLWLAQQVEAGVLCRWQPLTRDFAGAATENNERYVGLPSLSALTRRLAEGLQLETETRISLVWPEQQGVLLRDEWDNPVGEFDAALIATPAPQAAPLLDAVSRFRRRAESIMTTPAWVTLAAFAEPLATEVQCLLGDHPVLQRVVRESAKPGRHMADTWAIQARADWSQLKLDSAVADVEAQLLEALGAVLSCQAVPLASRTQRWLYCHSSTLADKTHLWGADVAIGACGDWFGQGGVEGAWRSGRALAQAVICSLQGAPGS